MASTFGEGGEEEREFKAKLFSLSLSFREYISTYQVHGWSILGGLQSTPEAFAPTSESKVSQPPRPPTKHHANQPTKGTTAADGVWLVRGIAHRPNSWTIKLYIRSTMYCIAGIVSGSSFFFFQLIHVRVMLMEGKRKGKSGSGIEFIFLEWKKKKWIFQYLLFIQHPTHW